MTDCIKNPRRPYGKTCPCLSCKTLRVAQSRRAGDADRARRGLPPHVRKSECPNVVKPTSTFCYDCSCQSCHEAYLEFFGRHRWEYNPNQRIDRIRNEQTADQTMVERLVAYGPQDDASSAERRLAIDVLLRRQPITNREIAARVGVNEKTVERRKVFLRKKEAASCN